MREAAARELPDQRPLFLTVYGEQTSENSKIDVDLHTISTYPGFWGKRRLRWKGIECQKRATRF